MSEIVITEFMDEASVDDLRTSFDVLYDPGLVDAHDRLLASLADCRGLIVRNRTRVEQTLLDAAPNLKVVGRLGVGLDNIDLDACAARGIAVKPATGANNASVAEYVIGAALVLIRGVFGSTKEVAEGAWPRQALMGGEMGGRVLGLVGCGAIARETARLAMPFGVTVIGHDPMLAPDDPVWSTIRPVQLDTLLETADVISLHVPLTDQTRHMLDARAFARMKNSAIVINAARGGVLDEAALVEALKSGRLGGAALDVFENEPLDAEHSAQFAGIPKIILTPHVAGVTGESNVRVSGVTADNVRSALGEVK